jgi:hypothetical protein
MAVNVVANPTTLTWSNFRVVDSSPDLSDDEVAQIHPEMRMPPNIQVANSNGAFRLNALTITVAPVAQDTIVLRSATQTPDLLRHEQGHYDLLILVARAMARDLGAASASSSAALNTQVQSIQQTHNNNAQTIDDAYDKQTDHGKNSAQQTGWNQAIAAALGNPASSTVKGMQL